MRSMLTASRALLPALLLTLTACSGGSKGDPDNRGPFEVSLISNGRGQLFPYRLRLVDSVGLPTAEIVNVTSKEILERNLNEDNGVLPVASFPREKLLPNGDPGNQYLQVRFTHKLGLDSILSDRLSNSATNSGLTTALSVLAYDPFTEQTLVLKGRGFIDGKTYVSRGGALQLVQAVEVQDGEVVIRDSIADGFPRGFSNDVDLVSPKSFVFVADSDGDLSSFETFDELNAGHLIQIVVTNAVRNSSGAVLEQEVRTVTQVGEEEIPPQVIGWRSQPNISPGNGQTGVDPAQPIRIQFSKPVQPWALAASFSRTNLTPQPGGITLNVTASAQTFGVLYYADPVGYGDLTAYLVPPCVRIARQHASRRLDHGQHRVRPRRPGARSGRRNRLPHG